MFSNLWLAPILIILDATPTHRYWRLKGTTAGTYDGGALAEIEFYSTIGGASIATGGTASSGSNGAGGLPENAFDGLLEAAGGMWAGASGAVVAGTSWVAYDFGTPVSVVSHAITARNSSWANQVWDGWNLEYSDDNITWTIHSSYSDLTTWAVDEQKTYIPPADEAFQTTFEQAVYIIEGVTPTDAQAVYKQEIYVIEGVTPADAQTVFEQTLYVIET
jgi:hypothetical protein